MSKVPRTFSRRKFAFAASTAATALPLVARQSQTPAQTPNPAGQNANTTLQNTSTPLQREVAPEQLPFEREITFARKRVQPSVEAFQMTDVKLLPSRFK